MLILPENAWDTIRHIIKDNFSFYDIKDIVSSAGLPVHKLSHLQQKYQGGASKGQLMDSIENLYDKLSSDQKNSFLIFIIEKILKLNSNLVEKIDEALRIIGWGISDNIPYPLELQIDIEIAILPEKIKKDINKSIRRYRNGDLTGAITSICGAVDLLTEEFFNKNPLGNHRKTSYQERISKSMGIKEVVYKKELQSANLSEQEIKLIWQNHLKAVSNAAYVLGSFRREFSDVHGSKLLTKYFIQKAIDSAVFIIRSLL